MANVPENCNCEACQALAERYASDPALLVFYRKKLLLRGWAGDRSKVERSYILAHAEWAQGLSQKYKERWLQRA